MSDTTVGDKRQNALDSVYDQLYEVWDGLEEAWLALGADEDISDSERKKRREAIEAQVAELKLQESELNLAKINALDENDALDKLLADLEDATAKSRDEIQRMRRATKVARQVAEVANAATKVIGAIAKFLA